jgi:hypothetical protein
MNENELRDLRDRLRRAASARNPILELQAIVEELPKSGTGLSAVRPILEFMEEHPELDLGAPGPLVHFVEEFYRKGYEAELLASIARRPTAHTVWMLNRIVNGVKNERERQKLLVALEGAGKHPAADEATKQAVSEFLED